MAIRVHAQEGNKHRSVAQSHLPLVEFPGHQPAQPREEHGTLQLSLVGHLPQNTQRVTKTEMSARHPTPRYDNHSQGGFELGQL